MKVMCKVMTVFALCAGFLQITEAANLKVKMVKVDPASRKKTWSYKIIPQKQSIIKPRLRKFKEETILSINPKDFESSLRVYTNSTGAEKNKSEFKDLSLAEPVIKMFQNKEHIISIDKDGNFNIMSKNDMERLQATDGLINTREISVEKVGSNRKKWGISSWVPGKGGVVDSVKIKADKTKAERKLAIPAKGDVVFIFNAQDTTQPSPLTIEENQVAKLKVLKLDDDGKQVQ